jgi:DNA-binding response OmpR family regulator
MRVLIVEDEPYLAEAVRDGLRLEAIAADIAGDGDTALELLSINSYDLAVLDRDIPGPSGDEIARRIVASGSGMPILMLTAADRIDDKASGFGLGADDYLTKPFELRELAARMASNGSLSHRILLEGRDDEFRELADVFDTMLDQLESHVAEQRRFAANASHELRTPLAISRTLLDVARKDPARDQNELIERLHAVNTRAIDGLMRTLAGSTHVRASNSGLASSWKSDRGNRFPLPRNHP